MSNFTLLCKLQLPISQTRPVRLVPWFAGVHHIFLQTIHMKCYTKTIFTENVLSYTKNKNKKQNKTKNKNKNKKTKTKTQKTLSYTKISHMFYPKFIFNKCPFLQNYMPLGHLSQTIGKERERCEAGYQEIPQLLQKQSTETDTDEDDLLCILLNSVEEVCVIWSAKQFDKVFIMSDYYQLKVTLSVPTFDDTVVNEMKTNRCNF